MSIEIFPHKWNSSSLNGKGKRIIIHIDLWREKKGKQQNRRTATSDEWKKMSTKPNK